MAEQIIDISPDQVPSPKWDEIIKQYNQTGVVNYGTGSSIVAGKFQSTNFKTGSDGWQLDSNGNLEANDGNFRGDITGATGTFSGSLTGGSLNIPDTTSANSFHVDSSGNAWWGTNVSTGYATAPAKILNTGAGTFSNITITGGSVATSVLDKGVMAWETNIVFSATDADTVAWTSGVIKMQDTTTYNISAGNTGNMSALTYIYLDIAVSLTVLQTTTTYSTAVGNGKILICTALNQTSGYASFIPRGGQAPAIAASQINSGSFPSSALTLSSRGWTQTCVFSVTDLDTVAWGTGTFTSADGTAYSISAGNTGNMSAKTYIYLDTAVSTTAYQTTTTATNALGDNRVLVAVAQNGTAEATFSVLGGMGGQNIDAANIVAGSITGNEIAATTITASNIASGTITTTQIASNTIAAGNIAASTITSDKMNVSTLSAISANLGTITAGSITINGGVASIGTNGDATFKSIQVGGSNRQYSLTDGGIFSFGDGSDGDVELDGGTIGVSVDSYSESNANATIDIKTTNSVTKYGQTFTVSSTTRITQVKFYLKKSGSPTGNGYAKIYNLSGGVPTGSALATSDPLDLSTLTTSMAVISFNFTGLQRNLFESGTYGVVFEPDNVTSPNYTVIGVDSTSPSHGGTSISYNGSSWSASASYDASFYIVGNTESTTTLTSDMYYQNLTINEADVLKPDGYRIFVQDTLTLNGIIDGSGTDGTDGNAGPGEPSGTTSNTSGPSGVSMADGYLKGCESTGSGGYGHGTNSTGAGGQGGNGTAVTNALGFQSSLGGSGGSSLGSGGSSGTIATVTEANVKLIANWHLSTLLDISSTGSTVKFTNSASAPGGGGGGGGSSGGCTIPSGASGGSGGSGGCHGRIVAIYAKKIIVGENGLVNGNGGKGGNGGDGGSAHVGSPCGGTTKGGGGGGGGGGGNGGIIIAVYNSLTDNTQSGASTVAGGAGGTGGAGGAGDTAGNDGNDGVAGSDGIIYTFQISL